MVTSCIRWWMVALSALDWSLPLCMAPLWSFIFRKRGWRHHVLSNGRVSTATSSDVPYLRLSPWLSSVVRETEERKTSIFSRMNWWSWRTVWCHGWSSSRLCLATWVPKVGVDTGQPGHEDPLLLIVTIIIDHPFSTRIRSYVCSPVLSELIWTVYICTGSDPAEWIPPCSSSCCTSWSHTSWSAAGCSTADRAPSPAKQQLDLCSAQGECVCV